MIEKSVNYVLSSFGIGSTLSLSRAQFEFTTATVSLRRMRTRYVLALRAWKVLVHYVSHRSSHKSKKKKKLQKTWYGPSFMVIFDSCSQYGQPKSDAHDLKQIFALHFHQVHFCLFVYHTMLY